METTKEKRCYPTCTHVHYRKDMCDKTKKEPDYRKGANHRQKWMVSPRSH